MSADPMQQEYLSLLVQLRQHCEIQFGLGQSLLNVPKLEPLRLPRPERAPQRQPAHDPRADRPRSRSTQQPRPRSRPPEPTRTAPAKALFPGLDKTEQGPVIKPIVNETPEELERRRDENHEKLRELYLSLQGCQKCRLSQGRNKIVFGQGDPAAEIVFIGEAPGADEDREGLAFIGKAGQLLTKMIRAMGLDREEVFIANIAKCRPPGNRKPQPDEMDTCVPYLVKQLEIIRPKLIVALGKTAGEGLGVIRPEEGLTRNCGFRKQWRGIRVMLTFHPSYLLRQSSAKRAAWNHLQQVMPYIKRRRK